jgi:putative flippase GtrA
MVGASGLFVDTVVLVSFVEVLSFDPRFAAVFAFFVAATWNYYFNRIWTFRIGKNSRTFQSYIVYICVCLLGLGVRIAVMHLLIESAGMGKRPWYILASILGVLAGTAVNFLGSKYFAFSKRFAR